MRKNKFVFSIISIGITVLITHFCKAQTIHFSEQLTTRNGLNSTTVYNIFQDKNRFLWLSSDVGVSRYDGSEIINFDYQDGLPDHDVFSVKQTKDGTIWLLTYDGKLVSYKKNQFRIKKELSGNAYLTGFIEDENTFLVASFGEGVRVLKNNQSHHILTPHPSGRNFVFDIWNGTNGYYAINAEGIHLINRDRLTTSLVHKRRSRGHNARILQLSQDSVLFTTKEGVSLFVEPNRVIPLENAEEFAELIINDIQKIDGEVYICTDQGVYIVLIKENQLKIVRRILKDYRVSHVFKDHEGNFWFSTLENGVFRRSRINVTQISPLATYCLTLYENKVVAGMRNGSYQEIFSNENIRSGHLNYSKDIITRHNQFFNAQFFTLQGSVIMKKNALERKVNIGKASILELGDKILIGNQAGLWLLNKRDFFTNVCSGNQTLSENEQWSRTGFKVKDIVRYDSKIYVLTNKGLYHYSLDNKLSRKGFEKLISKNVTDIDFKEGNLIVSTFGHGLFIFENNKLRDHITISQGLNSNYCLTACFAENKNQIIVGGHTGLCILNIENGTLNIRHIQESDGLPSEDVLDLSFFDGLLYFATSKGLFRLNPNEINIRTSRPIVRIESMLVNEKKYGAKNLDLSYWQNKLDFQLNTVAFLHQSEVKYEYRLNRRGKWKIAPKGQIQFPSLMPGNYFLEVRAKVGSQYSKIKKVQFVISPPFWETTWFLFLLILIFIGLIYLFFRIRVLSYNRDVVRELIQLLIDKVKKQEFIFVKNTKDGSMTKVLCNRLRYIKGADNYIELILDDQEVILVRGTLTHILENELKGLKTPFIRCHRSYIINVRKLTAVHNKFLKIQDDVIPIGKKYFKTIQEKKSLLKIRNT